MSKVIVDAIKAEYPNINTNDMDDILSIIHNKTNRSNGYAIIKQQNEIFSTHCDHTTLKELIDNMYHEAYEHAWKYMYRSKEGLNGNVSGEWWECVGHALLQNAANKSKIKEYIVAGLKNNNEDHDKFIGLNNSEKWLSMECKLQSDRTSLKKALGTYKLNTKSNSVQHCCLLIASNGMFTSRNGEVGIYELQDAGISEIDARRVVSEIITKQTGVFNINNHLSVIILGYNKPEYVAWDGNYMKNLGGGKGWTLEPNAIDEAVDYLSTLLDNIKSNKEIV